MDRDSLNQSVPHPLHTKRLLRQFGPRKPCCWLVQLVRVRTMTTAATSQALCQTHFYTFLKLLDQEQSNSFSDAAFDN